MADEGVELREAAAVEQLVDPLPGGQLALRVLLVDRRVGGRMDRLLAGLTQVGELLLVGLWIALAHRRRRTRWQLRRLQADCGSDYEP